MRVVSRDTVGAARWLRALAVVVVSAGVLLGAPGILRAAPPADATIWANVDQRADRVIDGVRDAQRALKLAQNDLGPGTPVPDEVGTCGVRMPLPPGNFATCGEVSLVEQRLRCGAPDN